MDNVTHASFNAIQEGSHWNYEHAKNNSLVLLQRRIFAHSGAVTLVKIVTMLGQQKFKGYLWPHADHTS